MPRMKYGGSSKIVFLECTGWKEQVFPSMTAEIVSVKGILQSTSPYLAALMSLPTVSVIEKVMRKATICLKLPSLQTSNGFLIRLAYQGITIHNSLNLP